MLEKIKEILNNSKNKECYSYSDSFVLAIKEEKDPEILKKLILLQNITSYYFDSNDIKEPFKSFAVLNDGRTPNLSDLNDSDFSSLEELIEIIEDNELKARVCDIFWNVKKDYRKAQVAIKEYLLSTNNLVTDNTWTYVVSRIQRATIIAKSIDDKKENNVTIVKNFVIDFLIKTDINKYGPLIRQILFLMGDMNIGNYSDYEKIIEDDFSKCMSIKKYESCIKYMNIKSKWHNKDTKKKDEINRNIAELYELIADEYTNEENPNIFTILNLYEDAISSFMNVSESKKDIERIQKKRDLYKAKYTPNLEEHIVEMDFSEIGNVLEKEFRNKSNLEILESFICLPFLLTKTDLQKLLKEKIELNPLSFIFDNITVDKDFRKINILKNDNIIDEDFINSEEHLHHIIKEHCSISSIIIKMIQQFIHNNNLILEDDIENLLKNNILVEDGRKKLLKKGLIAGINGDFIVSSHLLIPQIENICRNIARNYGAVITTLDKDGIESYKTLGIILDLPQMKDNFDESLLLYFNALFAKKSGFNARNDICHALLDSDEIDGQYFVYIWWFFLKLCYMFHED